MKKIILFIAALFIVNFASAQAYYGYCTAQLGGNTYVSEVKDLTTLPNNNIPTKAPYGKIKLVDYYSMVAKQWFATVLANNGLDAKQGAIYTQLIAGTSDYSNTCKTGYEPGCLCQDKNAALEQRNKNLKADHKTIELK